MTSEPLPRLFPTGKCWCGCGYDTSDPRNFFLQGHDKLAEGALLAAEFGASVAQLLHAYHYGPDHSVRQAAVDKGTWISCTHPGCRYTGAPGSVRRHQLKAHVPAGPEE